MKEVLKEALYLLLNPLVVFMLCITIYQIVYLDSKEQLMTECRVTFDENKDILECIKEINKNGSRDSETSD